MTDNHTERRMKVYRPSSSSTIWYFSSLDQTSLAETLALEWPRSSTKKSQSTGISREGRDLKSVLWELSRRLGTWAIWRWSGLNRRHTYLPLEVLSAQFLKRHGERQDWKLGSVNRVEDFDIDRWVKSVKRWRSEIGGLYFWRWLKDDSKCAKDRAGDGKCVGHDLSADQRTREVWLEKKS